MTEDVLVSEDDLREVENCETLTLSGNIDREILCSGRPISVVNPDHLSALYVADIDRFKRCGLNLCF